MSKQRFSQEELDQMRREDEELETYNRLSFHLKQQQAIEEARRNCELPYNEALANWKEEKLND